ncbi:MAG: DoxX family protein [Bacteroidetes bacterium]|nr:DoxX family protein [Bacteroidota bacterium]
MDILIILGLLIAGCLLNFIAEPGFGTANVVSRLYLVFSIVLAGTVWIYYFAGIKNAATLNVLNILLQYGGYLSRLLLGFLTGNILVKIWHKDGVNDRSGLKAIIRTTLWAISIAIANSYLVATVGKSQNMPYMIGFFKQSGYAIWFLYFIMAAESLCALGILLHFKLKTGIYASLGLVVIMLGAVYTHLHNRDPFSDSYAAISELISLILLLLIYYFEKLTPKSPETQIYVV